MDKNQTSNNKYNIFEHDTLNMNLSKMLEAASTSKERGLKPYWTESCQEMSKRLLLHTETGCAGSDLIFSQPLQTSLTQGSWFLTEVHSHLKKSLSKTYFPSSMFSPVGFMDSENTVIRSKKIRIYPKPESKQRLNKYLGLSRYWYNQAIAYLQKDGTKAYLPEVRKIQKEDHPEWAFDCPQRVREHSFADACKAVKNAKRKCKTEGFQEVSFRSKKEAVQRFGFDKAALQQDFIFKQSDYKALFKATEAISPELEGARIVREDYRWFAIVPQNRVVKLPENQRGFIVAIDPGVKTFATFYSATTHGKIGQADFKKITRLCIHMDKLISRMSKAKSKAKQNINRALQRMRWRIFDLIDDLHKKTAHFLVTHFDYILLPSFQTASMSQKLHSKVARSMLTFAHYRFKQFLNAKAEEYSAKVIEVQEAFTSMTCSYCGKIAPVGNKSVKKCSCGCVVDRDYNGARGIFLSSCFGGYAPA